MNFKGIFSFLGFPFSEFCCVSACCTTSSTKSSVITSNKFKTEFQSGIESFFLFFIPFCSHQDHENFFPRPFDKLTNTFMSRSCICCSRFFFGMKIRSNLICIRRQICKSFSRFKKEKSFAYFAFEKK